jgi:Predicted transcriptional regulators
MIFLRREIMRYTVHEVAKLTGVTVKTLHHYHKIGLLKPREITNVGYRLYGTEELERLQQILYYRELDFSLNDVKKALEDEPSRLACLIKQQELLFARRQRMDRLLRTLEESIRLATKGETMDKSVMFQGFTKEEWTKALAEQNEYLKSKYGCDMLESGEIQADKMNESAIEAQQFIGCLSNALKNGWKPTDERLQKALKEHIHFLSHHGVPMNAKTLVNQAKFMVEDDFHRKMLENQQTGLSYYFLVATEMYAVV